MTNNLQYKTQLEQFNTQLAQRKERLAELDIRRSELQTEIVNLKKAIGPLQLLCGITKDDADVSGLGLTDAIRKIFSLSWKEWISAGRVKEKLREKGFDFSDYSNPMSSIYKILVRLRANEEIELKTEGRNTFYKFKPKRHPRPFRFPRIHKNKKPKMKGKLN